MALGNVHSWTFPRTQASPLRVTSQPSILTTHVVKKPLSFLGPWPQHLTCLTSCQALSQVPDAAAPLLTHGEVPLTRPAGPGQGYPTCGQHQGWGCPSTTLLPQRPLNFCAPVSSSPKTSPTTWALQSPTTPPHPISPDALETLLLQLWGPDLPNTPSPPTWATFPSGQPTSPPKSFATHFTTTHGAEVAPHSPWAHLSAPCLPLSTPNHCMYPGNLFFFTEVPILK